MQFFKTSVTILNDVILFSENIFKIINIQTNFEYFSQRVSLNGLAVLQFRDIYLYSDDCVLVLYRPKISTWRFKTLLLRLS